MDMVGSVMDAVGGLLGGDEAAPAKTKAEKPPEFQRREGLAESGATGEKDGAPQNLNKLDGAPVDFIHFGRIHSDDGTKFTHAEMDDLLGELKLKEDLVGRAACFRAAVERETLLLHSFMEATKKALKEYEDSQGAAGELVGAAMDLLGGSSKEEPPSSAELDLHKKDAATAGGAVNKAEIAWIDVHTAGRDLHLWRADYHEFCRKCEKHFVKKDGGGGGGPLGSITSMIPAGVPNAVKTVVNIVFKVQDLFLAMYLLCRAEFEDDIEDACYELTIKAIKEKWRPVFPIWFPQPPEKEEEKKEEEKKDKNFLEEAVDDVNKKIEEAKQKVEDAKNTVKGFLGIEDDPPKANGAAALDAIFQKLVGEEETEPKKPKLPTVAETYVRAFEEVVGVKPLPGFIVTVIKEVTAVNLGLMHRVYKAIMYGRASTAIGADAMVLAGRQELAAKLMSIAGKFIPFLGKDDKLVSLGGVGDLGGEQLQGMGAKYIDQFLGPQIGRIAELSSAKLAPHLEEARTSAGDAGRTMELFLGRLPWLLTLQFRNTFFPMVDMLLDKVFGAIGGGAAAAMNPCKKLLGDAKGVYGDAKEKYDEAMAIKEKAEKAQKKLAEGVDLVEAAKDPGAFVDSLTGEDPEKKKDKEAAKPEFPGSDRLNKGRGKKVTAAESDEVKTQQDELTIVTP